MDLSDDQMAALVALRDLGAVAALARPWSSYSALVDAGLARRELSPHLFDDRKTRYIYRLTARGRMVEGLGV